MPISDGREQTIEYLRSQLIGPTEGPDETLHDPPGQRYLMGLLFPKRADMEETLAAETFGEIAAETIKEPGDDPVALSSQHMPSSVGLSFLTAAGNPVEVVVSAATYGPSGTMWERQDQAEDPEPLVLRPPDKPGLQRIGVLNGRAEITSRWRRFGDANLVTVALVNLAETADGDRIDQSTVLCRTRQRTVWLWIPKMKNRHCSTATSPPTPSATGVRPTGTPTPRPALAGYERTSCLARFSRESPSISTATTRSVTSAGWLELTTTRMRSSAFLGPSPVPTGSGSGRQLRRPR